MSPPLSSCHRVKARIQSLSLTQVTSEAHHQISVIKSDLENITFNIFLAKYHENARSRPGGSV